MRGALAALFLTVAVAAAAIVPGASAVVIVPCDGHARPAASDGERIYYEIKENTPVPTMLGVLCLPGDHTVTASRIDWGDGTSSPVNIAYYPTDDGATRQAWLIAPHTYPRATCPTGFCMKGYRVTATVTDDQSGDVVPLVIHVAVMPAIDVLTTRSLHAHAHRLTRVRLGSVKTGGTRSPGEISARVYWEDGRSSQARVSGSGRNFTITAVHRWRVEGTHSIVLRARDRFSTASTQHSLRVRVTR